MIVAAGVWWRSPAPARPAGPPPGLWIAQSLTGTPTVAGTPLRGELRVGGDGVIETDASSSVRLSAAGVGMIDLGPGTRLRTVPSGEGEYRLALDRGTLHAHIWATPGSFVVETASAAALDLGCSYRLDVDPDGGGRLRVTLGWVGLGQREVESLVPQGAVCVLRPGAGPGTPYFDDAPGALVEALSMIDGAAGRMPAGALDSVLAAARPRDAFTLWHLLRRADGADAKRLFAAPRRALAAAGPSDAGVDPRERQSCARSVVEHLWPGGRRSSSAGGGRVLRCDRGGPQVMKPGRAFLEAVSSPVRAARTRRRTQVMKPVL